MYIYIYTYIKLYSICLAPRILMVCPCFLREANGGFLVPKSIQMGLPVVPHKAVAEASRIDNYRRGELL